MYNEHKREEKNDSKEQYYKFAYFLLLRVGVAMVWAFILFSSEEVERWIKNLKLVMVSNEL